MQAFSYTIHTVINSGRATLLTMHTLWIALWS